MPARLSDALRRRGIVKFTEIQRKAFPAIVSGQNVLLIAPTGSGKTEAAVIPIYKLMIEKKARPLAAIYVTPLRALNRDIFRRIAELGRDVGLNVMLRHGDTPRKARRLVSENPPHLLITTPETLQYLLLDERLRQAFRELRWVIVDEIHELLDNKRGSELTIVLERISALSRHRVQRIGLSASIGDPWTAARFLAGWARGCLVVEVPGIRRARIMLADPKPEECSVEEAEELGVSRETCSRLKALARAVRRSGGKTLIFTNTRDTAEFVASKLRFILGPRVVAVHHGSLSRSIRVEVEERFKYGDLEAIVATSSMELGIDIGDVDLVVQYGSPRQAVRLLQRIGRSRHRAGLEAKGLIVTLGNMDDLLESAVIARRTVAGDLEEPEPYEKPLDALMHQVAGMVLEKTMVTLDEVYRVVTRAYPYSGLSMDELRELAEFMDSLGIVRLRDGVLKRGRRIYRYYYSVSMIPSTKRYPVVDAASNKVVGSLDEEFVVSSCETGTVIVLGGRLWRVLEVDERVRVEPVEEAEGILPAWEGELIPVEWRVAREVCSVIRRIAKGIPVKGYPFDRESLERLRELVSRHAEKYPVPCERLILVESLGRTVIVHVCLGSRGNEALGVLLSAMLRAHKGISIAYHATPYRIVLSTPVPLKASDVADELEWLASHLDEAELLITRGVTDTGMFRWRLLHVAKRMGLVEPGSEAKLTKAMLSRIASTLAGREALREVLHDKLDLDAVRWLLKGISSGRVKVEALDLREPTPLGRAGLESARFFDRISEALPLNVLVEIVKRRLLSKKRRLICMHCGYTWVEVVGRLPEKIRCPRCEAGFVSVTWPENEEAVRVVRKALRGEKLRGQEVPLLRELRSAGNLVLTYGRYAVIALTAYGIGPQTAVGVLAQLKRGEQAFYKAIFEAEKRFMRTRRFWD